MLRASIYAVFPHLASSVAQPTLHNTRIPPSHIWAEPPFHLCRARVRLLNQEKARAGNAAKCCFFQPDESGKSG